jgi:HEAT repeats
VHLHQEDSLEVSREAPPNGAAREQGASGLARPTVSHRNLLIAAVPVLAILVTFLFWYSTWFGRRLGPSEMREDLVDSSAPHRTQHALAQLADLISRGDPSAAEWYPQILSLAGNPEPQIRSMAAWVMGEDNREPRFHQALLKLVHDSSTMVRWNAALALVRFGDATGDPELRAMLQPYQVLAPAAGVIEFRSEDQQEVAPGTLIARVRAAKDEEVRSPLDGRLSGRLVPTGTRVEAGQPIARIDPGEREVAQALEALALVGTVEDLNDVQRYAQGMPGMSGAVSRQATAAAQAIRARGSAAGGSGPQEGSR